MKRRTWALLGAASLLNRLTPAVAQESYLAHAFAATSYCGPRLLSELLPGLAQLDADGNETSGLPAVQHQVPLGTYTGWNVTKTGFFQGQPCGGGLTGGYIPFAKTRAERMTSGDPRPSFEERYGKQQGYVASFAKRQRAKWPAACCCRRTPRSSSQKRVPPQSCPLKLRTPN